MTSRTEKPLSETLAKARRILAGQVPRTPGARFATEALPLGAALLLADALGSGCVLLITPTPEEAERALADAALLLPKRTCLLLSPADDEATLITGERITQVQAILQANTSVLCITSIHALAQPIPEPEALAAASLTLTPGQTLPFDELPTRLTAMGYTRAPAATIEEPLTFTLRGGILDLWPAGAEQPLRIEFFGDEVESLRTFSPATQVSTGRLDTFTLPPTPNARLATTYLPHKLPHAAALLTDTPAIDAALAQLRPIAPTSSNAHWLRHALAPLTGRLCWCGTPQEPGLPCLPLRATPIHGVRDLAAPTGATNPAFYAHLRQTLLADLDERARRGETIRLCIDSPAVRELLAHALPPDSPITFAHAPLSEGFALENPPLSLVAQTDLYPIRRSWRAPPRSTAKAGQRLEYAFDVEPGELVVHLEHGIGRFLGLAEVQINGQRSEAFLLEYAGGAKLYVPTTHAHLLSRYIGPNAHKVKLHTLDGKRWQSEKDAANQSIEDLAVRLLETQARRRVMPGFAFDLSSPWIAEFEALFPWQETPDQTRVIAEVKKDMAAPTAMDRLLCGDAGYGKTEVAMRAAFIAVANHKQVALLAPTTVLAEQHYATFCDRMAPFPIQIEVLSRFRTPAQRQATRQAAAQGKVDILIGTHALLTENIPFKDIGLIIIDEEQRFGVAHKEQLKRLRAIVDVLTMSATPIPRTLYLSLTGARDLSLLQTPPQNRLPVETLIQYDDDATIATAIQKELARGGQVFYLYNRVHTIGRLYNRLHALLPEARILIAHGQMPPDDLAQTMRAFEQGQADILLCTSIIESGIDIPRANTILIDRADRFGLAELYQLRGRVGRSALKGFAYLLLPKDAIIDADARKRLQALRRHAGLGAGYAIALRDLEIRGSGNLLGAAQSGHIAAIGFGLYCQLLRRTVARLKGEKPPTLVDVHLNIQNLETSPGADSPNAAAIPYQYIEDEAQRMNLYRRCAEATSNAEVNALERDIADRFGPLPPPAKRALEIARLRILAARKGIAQITLQENLLTCTAARSNAPIPTLNRRPIPPQKSIDSLLATLKRLISATA